MVLKIDRNIKLAKADHLKADLEMRQRELNKQAIHLSLVDRAEPEHDKIVKNIQREIEDIRSILNCI